LLCDFLQFKKSGEFGPIAILSHFLVYVPYTHIVTLVIVKI
jgi:hypothetical protein